MKKSMVMLLSLESRTRYIAASVSSFLIRHALGVDLSNPSPRRLA